MIDQRRRAAIRLLLEHPAQVARWCGLTKLNDDLHDGWLRQMLTEREDMTLLAHRGSFKTTCLAFAMAVLVLLRPTKSIIFMRKTCTNVTEIIKQVKNLLKTDTLQYLSAVIYGKPVRVMRSDMYSVETDLHGGLRGSAQIQGMGVRGAVTGKHADIIITDDIVTEQDRSSEKERLRVHRVYQELQCVLNPGGRFINTGTPWHVEDAISRMPNVRKYDCHQTGLLDAEQLRKLRGSMDASLFAANYELVHIAATDALFAKTPPLSTDESLLRDGMAHVDAAYGGGDHTALTCAKMQDGKVYLYGRLWKKHVEEVLDEILAECDRLMCGPILCETNGDKGFLAKEIRSRGEQVRTYTERANKHRKIASHLRKWWPHAVLVEGTDPAWLRQIQDYTENAVHDDAPDSAASLLRVIARHESPE